MVDSWKRGRWSTTIALHNFLLFPQRLVSNHFVIRPTHLTSQRLVAQAISFCLSIFLTSLTFGGACGELSLRREKSLSDRRRSSNCKSESACRAGVRLFRVAKRGRSEGASRRHRENLSGCFAARGESLRGRCRSEVRCRTGANATSNYYGSGHGYCCPTGAVRACHRHFDRQAAGGVQPACSAAH